MKPLILGTAGLQINIPIESFPYEYKSILFMDDQVHMDIAGVGYSHCLILGGLGDTPTFLTGIGNDIFASVIVNAVANTGAECLVDRKDKETLVSVILYDSEGRRSILREGRMDYRYKMNPKAYQNLEDDYDAAIFSLAGFSRDLLPIVKSKGIPIVCDMQTVDNLSNDYGKDFMEHSDIIFFSNDHYEGNLDALLKKLYQQYKFKVMGVGMGAEGCRLCVNGSITHYPAVPTEVKNTVGAGDALFGCFVHCYFNGDSAEVSIQKAQIFAAEKIRYATASKGFMSKEELDQKYNNKSFKI